MEPMGSSEPAATIAVIDGHDVVPAGIAAWCTAVEPPIRPVGAFHDPAEFLTAYPQTPNEIDVVVLDIQIDGKRPDFDSLRKLCARSERVIVFSDFTAAEVILTCLDLGAVTYLVKSEGRTHLMDAILAARTTTPYVGPQMARAIRNDSLLGRIQLSEREKEVLIAWFQTEIKDAVGQRLYIAPTTVRTHLQRARAKYASVARPPEPAGPVAQGATPGCNRLSSNRMTTKPLLAVTKSPDGVQSAARLAIATWLGAAAWVGTGSSVAAGPARVEILGRAGGARRAGLDPETGVTVVAAARLAPEDPSAGRRGCGDRRSRGARRRIRDGETLDNRRRQGRPSGRPVARYLSGATVSSVAAGRGHHLRGCRIRSARTDLVSVPTAWLHRSGRHAAHVGGAAPHGSLRHSGCD